VAKSASSGFRGTQLSLYRQECSKQLGRSAFRYTKRAPRWGESGGCLMVRIGGFRLATSVLAAAAVVAAPALAEPLTLAQAQLIALKRSPELGHAQARVGAAEAVEDQVKRERLPKVTVDAAAGWRHLENDARINLGFSAVNERPLYATITLDQAVWDFGKIGNEVRAQKANLAASQYEEQAAGETVAFNVSRAYLQAMVQERILAAAEDNLAFHHKLSADVTEGVARGAMSISERQQSEERLQSAKVLVAQARSDLEGARAELALLIGSEDFELSLPAGPRSILPVSLAEAVAVAEVNDPRLHASQNKLAAAGWSAKRTRSERWPTVSVRGSARAGEDFQGYRGETKEYELLFAMRWPLFDGGVTAARIRQADYLEDQARFVLAASQRDSELQVRKAWASLESWRSKFAEQQTRYAVAALVLDSYRAQFGIGRRSLLDLLDAQGSVYSATVDSEIARFGTLLAEYGMLAQVNRLREHFGIGKTEVDPRMYGPR
jgi:outer membrane protein, adhesin transport system